MRKDRAAADTRRPLMAQIRDHHQNLQTLATALRWYQEPGLPFSPPLPSNIVVITAADLRHIPAQQLPPAVIFDDPGFMPAAAWGDHHAR